jgi:hypothetical protein
MALPTSGPLTLTDIQTEFGGSAPVSLDEYYAGGAYVAAGTSGTYGAVPSSGTISIQNFYGTSKGPSAVGQPFGGGYFAGYISETGNGVPTHYLIISPRAYEVQNISWLDAGPYCDSLVIDGYDDWYLGSMAEWWVVYYFLKPTTNANSTTGGGWGATTLACSPQPFNTNYTASVPAQTTVADFIYPSGSQCLRNPYPQYWSNQTYGPTNAYAIQTQFGNRVGLSFGASFVCVRPFRKQAI